MWGPQCPELARALVALACVVGEGAAWTAPLRAAPPLPAAPRPGLLPRLPRLAPPACPRGLRARAREARARVAQRAEEDEAQSGKTPLRPVEVTPELEVEQLLDVGMRFEGLWALIDGLKRSGLSSQVRRGSIVIARCDVPALRIVESQSYEVTDIYLQGATDGDAKVERIALQTLDDQRPPGTQSHTRYIKLFSAKYHTEPVICTADEIGLVTLRDEITDAAASAVPILGFWISVCVLFWNYGSITSPPPPPPLASPIAVAERPFNAQAVSQAVGEGADEGEAGDVE